MKIVVTHNAITRLILEGLMKQNNKEQYVRIETRPDKIEEGKGYNLLYGNCNSNQTSAELIEFLDRFEKIIKNPTNHMTENELFIPHHNNDLYWILSEHPMIQRIYYIEEGDGSIYSKIRREPLKIHALGELKLIEKKIDEVGKLGQIMERKGYKKNAIDYMKTIKGNGHPTFVKHNKLKGCKHISELAFRGFFGRENIRQYIRELYKVNNKDRAIFYLPSKFTKAPLWIRDINNEEGRQLAQRAIKLCRDYKIKEIILKEHPSTNPEITNVIEKILEKEIEVNRWEEYLRNNEIKGKVHEAALLKFDYAIFSCKTSAISYTRTLSPETKLIFTSFFGKHDSF